MKVRSNLRNEFIFSGFYYHFINNNEFANVCSKYLFINIIEVFLFWKSLMTKGINDYKLSSVAHRLKLW
jgi:hypothetical protein